jgi:hypothetical protein
VETTGPPRDESAVSALIVNTGSFVEFAVMLGSTEPPGAFDGFDVKGTRERGRWLACDDARLVTGLASALPGVPAAISALLLIAAGTAVGLEAAAVVAPGLIAVVPAGPETLVPGT